MRTSATKRAHGSGEEASQAAGKLARQHPGQGGGLTSLAYRFRGAQPVHYELRPCGGQARLSRGRGAGRQNKAPARCGVGCLSARLNGVHIRTDQQVVNSMTANQSTPRPGALPSVQRVVHALTQIPVSSDGDRKRRSELEREVAVHSTSALLGSWVYSAFSAPDQKRRARGW